jgi:regulator of sigma E protease
MGRYLAMVFGIGLVIFVHEFGHFLAARLCGVRVDVFSLGFGPRLLAWRRGSTLYQLALLPLGGYVRMAGEEQEPGRAARPDELAAKSVGQRFLIYSGGVLMNVVFALVVFPVVLAVGVPMLEPVVGSVDPGGPAWRAGVEPGSRVLSVNGHAVIGFDNIGPEVALGSSESTALTLVPPGASESRTLEIPPLYAKDKGFYELGLHPATDRDGSVEVESGSPAWKAGMRTGDRLRSVAGAPPELTLGEQLLFATRENAPLDLAYQGADGAVHEAHLELELSTARGQPKLGIEPFANWVADLRESTELRALGLQKDDRILSTNGVALRGSADLLIGLRSRSDETRLLVERNGVRRELTGPGLTPVQALALSRDVQLRQDSASTRIIVRARSAAAEAGIRDGDRITSIEGHPVARFEDISPAVKAAGDAHALAVVLRRDGPEGGAETELSVSVVPRPIAQPSEDYGINLKLSTYVYQAPSPTVALRTGIQSSWRLMADSWLTLKRILTGQVSGENVGGIITIGVVSYSWAGQGMAKLFYFLCMLSVSLAFLNVLPIPVLDGGHLFFLLIEKLKGSPVSERVLSYSQIVGLVLLVSLVVYVTYNDIQRWIVH